jgi:molybdenum cofactor synthesis domain-containing protein
VTQRGSGRSTISFDDAQRRIVESCAPLGTERVALRDAAGRIAAATLNAREDLVPFARSAMDGFAMCAADLIDLPREFPVRARVYAELGSAEHSPQTATAIATGAPIPRGADTVLPIEDVETSDGVVRILRSVEAGSCIFPPGEDARAGDELIESGAVLRPSALGLLASDGYTEVEVFRKPRVVVVCTGDELVPIDAAPAYGQIRNSNAFMTTAAVEALGAKVVAASMIGDERAKLRHALEEAIGSADLVVTTGGASVGERDFVKPLLKKLGVEFLFDTVALRPAKPSAFGRRAAAAGAAPVHVAVLPGNPSSAFIALQEFVRPALFALGGRRDPLPSTHPARLDGRIRAKPNSTYACYAQIRLRDGSLVARPLDNQCSALTRSASEADGFILAPPGTETFTTGAIVSVDIFDWTYVGR